MSIIDNRPLVSAVIEKRRVLTTGEHAGKAHIKIVVTFISMVKGEKHWKRHHYKTGWFEKVKDFERAMACAPKEINKLPTLLMDLRMKVDKQVEVARALRRTYNDREGFEMLYLAGHGIDEIDGEFNTKITELRTARPRPKISSAEKYRTSLYSIKEFFKGDSETPVPVTFAMCTPDKLQEYEDWYSAQKVAKNSTKNKSLTSVGINMRHFRHIFKRAIKRGIAAAELYPFGIGGYVIPEGGDDTKKFMEKQDKDGFVEWRHPEDETTNELHDYALFSYFGFGMNMSDLARLTKDRVFKEHLTITRQKTKGRKKKNKVTTIPLHPIMKEIIRRRGNKSLIPDDFVFPILEYGWDEEKIFYRIRKLVDDVNEVLALIAKELNFEIKPTSYTLRHSFSFHFMQQEGATTEDLQDALGHGLIKTTEAYKHGFGLERKKKFSEGL